MGDWYTEEVAGDVYIYDRDMPHAFGQPQCAPLASLPDDFVHAAALLCAAHNTALDAKLAEECKAACRADAGGDGR